MSPVGKQKVKRMEKIIVASLFFVGQVFVLQIDFSAGMASELFSAGTVFQVHGFLFLLKYPEICESCPIIKGSYFQST